MIDFFRKRKEPYALVYLKNSPAIEVTGGIDWEVADDWTRVNGAKGETCAFFKTDLITAIVQKGVTEWN